MFVAPLAEIEPATHGLGIARWPSGQRCPVHRVAGMQGFLVSAVRRVPTNPGSNVSFATQTLPNTRRVIAAIKYGGAMNRITVDPKVMGGIPCLRGLRIPVATVVNMVAGGLSVQEIVDELPPLEADDVAAALRFAADAVSDREILLQASV